MISDAESGERGRLYVVATPIGNLGDMTLRAIETLRSVRAIAAEDTRHTGRLLHHFGIRARLISYHAHNMAARAPQVLQELAHGDVALVSDAGTPAVSDPGRELVRAASEAGHAVVPIPGASAPMAAASISGLDTSAIHFIGFLPRRQGERRRALHAAGTWPGVVTCFETPHRLRAALADILAALGDREIVICCELTKLFEQVFRGTVSGAIAHYETIEPRGEFTLVLGGGDSEAERPPDAQSVPHDLDARFATLVQALGDRKRALATLATETGLSRKALYARVMKRPPA